MNGLDHVIVADLVAGAVLTLFGLLIWQLMDLENR